MWKLKTSMLPLKRLGFSIRNLKSSVLVSYGLGFSVSYGFVSTRKLKESVGISFGFTLLGLQIWMEVCIVEGLCVLNSLFVNK